MTDTPKDKPSIVAASNGLKVNVEVLCDKLATARVAMADVEANMKVLRDLLYEINIRPNWAFCQRIAQVPDVDEALRLFAQGESTEDQAIAIVQAVLTVALKN